MLKLTATRGPEPGFGDTIDSEAMANSALNTSACRDQYSITLQQLAALFLLHAYEGHLVHNSQVRGVAR